jgi:predicted  nucleic acid-binding Zn-ribbon protein
MTSAADLFALQEVDLKRDARRSLIADVDARLGETEELIAAREAVVSAEGLVESLRQQQKDLETQVIDLDAKMTPLETRLYDGSVRNPKELSDMQKELDIFKAQRSVLDDAGLSLIEQMEKAQNNLRGAQEDVEDSEKYWAAEQEELKAAKARAEKELVSLDADREARTADMDRSAIGMYENLRKAKGGRAVALVQRGICQGCRISLPSHLVQRMRTGATVQCVSCERILVAD